MTTENTVSPSAETQNPAPEVTQTTEVVNPNAEVDTPQEQSTEKVELSDAEKEARAKQRRIDRLTRNTYELRAQNEQLARSLAQMQRQPVEKHDQGGQISDAQINELVQRRAQEMLRSQTVEQRTASVDAELQKIVGSALPEFYDEIKQAGAAGSTLVQAAIELDDAPAVLAYLAKNVGEFDKVIELSPLKQAAFLGKLSAKLESEKTAPKRSAAPEPIAPIKGAVVKSDEPDINDTARWIAWSNKQDELKRRR